MLVQFHQRPDDEGSKNLRNADKRLPNYIPLEPRR